jgi:hypothetical protein
VHARADCPSGVHQGKGLTFRCTARTARGTQIFIVEQKDDKGDVLYRAP